MKKFLAMILALLMVASLAACGGRDVQEPSSKPEEPSSPVEEVPETPEETPEETPAGEVDPKLTQLHEGLKEAYGENYLPSMPLDETMMSEVIGINMENVESFIAEMPMMSAHVDTFIGIKAKEGKADQVEEELKAYHNNIVENSMQYPMNEGKVKASQVVRKGDYVFMMMLGQIPDETITDTAAFGKEQMQIGLDKLEEIFK
ncbi:MAG: DUF4358 domain-containing protein [Oscillospiraceae bacterium]|nr:DUF4358 domain-containing protein [Oscillospiraceae bacterium]